MIVPWLLPPSREWHGKKVKWTDQGADLNTVEQDFARPGKPTDNSFILALNGRLGQERHNTSWFQSMADARARVAEWRADYSQNRPHSGLGGSTPAEVADRLKPARKVA